MEDDVSTEDLARMPYLDQVYKETLRWTSVIPFIARKTNKEVALGRSNEDYNITILWDTRRGGG